MANPVNVTLTQAVQSKCNYGKAGQEQTDESYADQSSSTQDTCYLKSKVTKLELRFQLSSSICKKKCNLPQGAVVMPFGHWIRKVETAWEEQFSEPRIQTKNGC